MNPLLLLLLVGGGAYATVKVVQAVKSNSDDCVTNLIAPPANPYFTKVSGKYTVDYQAVADTLQAKSKAEKGRRDAKLAQYAGTAAAIAAMIPGIGTAGAGIIIAAAAVAGVALKAWDWLSGDDNSDEYKNRVIEYADRLIQWGFIPPAPNQNVSMRQTANGLAVDLVAIESSDPYVSWLFKTAGALFVKWGGEDKVLAMAAPYVVGERVSEGTFPPPAFCEDKAWDDVLAQGAARIAVFAQCIALEYGVQAKADQVIAEAIRGTKEWKTLFSMYPNARGMNDKCGEFLDPMKGYRKPSDPPCEGVTQGYRDLFIFCNPGLTGRHFDFACGYYSFAAGIYYAIRKASRLACKAPPPPMSMENLLKGPTEDQAFMNQEGFNYTAIERLNNSILALQKNKRLGTITPR